MDTTEFDLQQKAESFASISSQFPQKFTCGGVGSPSQNARKPLHPRTPNISHSNASSSCSFPIFPNQVVITPPAKRFHRVRNPFEAALSERLHLPLIASPSLFQRPTTPQMSSTQFEWTIDDVSSLKPANVEPHETQFQDSPDPDYEAKAQSAISSYFKEQQIVPSPVDCPLRSQRIILSELEGNTPISKPGRRIRDFGTQTELSLPTVLPKALEEALKPYFQPVLAQTSVCESTPYARASPLSGSASKNCSGDVKDISLRRKLFDMHNIIVLDTESHVPGNSLPDSNSSPISVAVQHHTAIVGKLSDSTDKSSFGSLSPISASDGLSISPHSPCSSKRKSRLQNFLDFCESETLSPIHPPTRSALSCRKSLKNSINAEIYISAESYRSPPNVNEQTYDDLANCGEPNRSQKFTPDRSSSPLRGECSESFNNKVNRLVVNSSMILAVNKNEVEKDAKSSADADLFAHDDTNEMLEGEDEDMQMSQLSAQSSICSSSTSDTPRGNRRSANRKNLSRSFTAHWYEDNEDEEQAKVEQQSKQLQALFKSNSLPTVDRSEVVVQPATKSSSSEQRLLFYRTDSGFNEITSSQTTQQDDQLVEAPKSLESDISMACCSTPSKQLGDAF